MMIPSSKYVKLLAAILHENKFSMFQIPVVVLIAISWESKVGGILLQSQGRTVRQAGS